MYYFRMIQSLRSESTKSEDIFGQLQEIQESVRVAFLNCLLDFVGMKDDELLPLLRFSSLIFLPHFKLKHVDLVDMLNRSSGTHWRRAYPE